MRPRVFISYTHRSERDVTIAFRLARHLRDFGCEVWIDSQLQVGRRFPDQIYSTIINESDYFIVLLSPDSIKRDWVKREMTAARASWSARQRPLLLPALIAPCRIPDILGRELHCANFRDNYVDGLNEVIGEILRARHGDSSAWKEITDRLRACWNDDEEISRVLGEHKVGAGSLRVLEPEVFINRRDEIRLFLNMLKHDSLCRVLIFHHAGNEPRLGSSYLLRFLAQANLGDLAFLAGERKHLDLSWFSGFHRLLFRSGGGYAGSISYPTDMMVRTVNLVGEHLFPGYLRECKAYGNQSIGNRYNTGWNWFTLPSYELPLFVPEVSTLDFLEDINQPRILEKITWAFLEDMRRNFARVVWLIDGPWSDLPMPVAEWLGSILARVERGDIKNLWLVFGGQEPFNQEPFNIDIARQFQVIQINEIKPFHLDIVEQWLKAVFRLENEHYLQVLATAIWSASGGHPARIAHSIYTLARKYDNMRSEARSPIRFGILWPEWVETDVPNGQVNAAL